MYKIGLSRQDITAFVKGIGMMGWVKPGNVVEDVESNLYARAVVIQFEQQKIAIVVTETCFLTLAIRHKVIDILTKTYPHYGYHEQNVMLMATHTHSAPGGTSHFLLYNLSTPGYSQEVTQTFVNGIVEAILEADKNMTEGYIYFGKGEFEPSVNVAFNRAVEAWNMNPENEKFDDKTRNLALNRNMYVLRFEDKNHQPIGILNWFAVHTTTVHSEKKCISSDNKGYAALQFENMMKTKNPHFVAIFAQGAAGDVSPNFVIHPGEKEKRGETPDDFQNRKINGNYQLQHALSIFGEIKTSKPLPCKLDFVLDYFNMAKTEVNPEYVDGKLGITTGDPCFGTIFLGGTAEGLGIPKFWIRILERWIRKRNQKKLAKNEYFQHLQEVHREKTILINSSKAEFFGTSKFHRLPIPDFVDPFLAELRRMSAIGELEKSVPLTPVVLPLQIFVLGNVAIVCAPTELTTTCGKRIQKQLLNEMKSLGIEEVIVSAYANGYVSYCTTPEEYSLQLYEAASTLFGKYTLPAYQTHYANLVSQLKLLPDQRMSEFTCQPMIFQDEDLKNRIFTRFEGRGILR